MATLFLIFCLCFTGVPGVWKTKEQQQQLNNFDTNMPDWTTWSMAFMLKRILKNQTQIWLWSLILVNNNIFNEIFDSLVWKKRCFCHIKEKSMKNTKDRSTINHLVTAWVFFCVGGRVAFFYQVYLKSTNIYRNSRIPTIDSTCIWNNGVVSEILELIRFFLLQFYTTWT